MTTRPKPLDMPTLTSRRLPRTRTPTATTSRSCARTAGAPRRTRRGTCCRTSRQVRASSTWAAGPAPSPPTWPSASPRAPVTAVGDHRRGAGARRRTRSPGAGRRTSASRSPTSTPWTSRTTASTSCTPTRCSSTSPTRSWRCGRCGASASPAASSRRATATTAASAGSPKSRRWTSGCGCIRPWRRPTAATRTPGAGCAAGPWPPGSPRRPSRPAPRRGCSPTKADRQWWADLWADRTTKSSTAAQYVEKGFAYAEDLDAVAAGLAHLGGSGRRVVQRRSWRDRLRGLIYPEFRSPTVNTPTDGVIRVPNHSVSRYFRHSPVLSYPERAGLSVHNQAFTAMVPAHGPRRVADDPRPRGLVPRGQRAVSAFPIRVLTSPPSACRSFRPRALHISGDSRVPIGPRTAQRHAKSFRHA